MLLPFHSYLIWWANFSSARYSAAVSGIRFRIDIDEWMDNDNVPAQFPKSHFYSKRISTFRIISPLFSFHCEWVSLEHENKRLNCQRFWRCELFVFQKLYQTIENAKNFDSNWLYDWVHPIPLSTYFLPSRLIVFVVCMYVFVCFFFSLSLVKMGFGDNRCKYKVHVNSTSV